MSTSTLHDTCQELGVEILGSLEGAGTHVLTPEALRFLVELQRRFGPRRLELLQRRVEQQAALDAGGQLDFPLETAEIRSSLWRGASIPADLLDRRVEITGPVDRKMIINALNSDAKVFMADFEDSNSPTWENCLEGQANLRDANRGQLSYTSPQGKHYQLSETPAVLMVRPRGWHLDEAHVKVDGQSMSASLFDFGLYFFHNAAVRIQAGTGPYFYLPKIEHYLEARLWNDVFVHAQEALKLPQGSVRATVLIETLPAAFQMDEILYELREHTAGLNCGRWDYIFSFIKKFRNRPEFVMPDRAQVTMENHFLASYVALLIQICHKRGVHAMGGMAAQIPIKDNADANEAALAKVRKDKLREVTAGHDGTWVAHPGLIPIALEIFDEFMPLPNQLDKLPNPHITAADLIEVPPGNISEAGLRINIDVGIQYLAAWLCGNGCVPIYNLMEDAATAEISRSQVWQWIRHEARIDGRVIDAAWVQALTDAELARHRAALGDEGYARGRWELAGKLFLEMMTAADCPDFLTLKAYPHIC